MIWGSIPHGPLGLRVGITIAAFIARVGFSVTLHYNYNREPQIVLVIIKAPIVIEVFV